MERTERFFASATFNPPPALADAFRVEADVELFADALRLLALALFDEFTLARLVFVELLEPA